MSRKSYSEEESALIASCTYAKSVTEKAVRYTSSFMAGCKDLNTNRKNDYSFRSWGRGASISIDAF